MSTVQVDLSEELLQVANISGLKFAPDKISREVAKLLALELFREDIVSLGRAAELCGVSQAEFMQYAADREVSLHYSLDDLDQDRQFIGSILS
ncbi:MAG: UPF0175 family protein [Acidobacteria bacterium]|nr:UPF0175 family protein [Acidobacteriota bacterium]